MTRAHAPRQVTSARIAAGPSLDDLLLIDPLVRGQIGGQGGSQDYLRAAADGARATDSLQVVTAQADAQTPWNINLPARQVLRQPAALFPPPTLALLPQPSALLPQPSALAAWYPLARAPGAAARGARPYWLTVVYFAPFCNCPTVSFSNLPRLPHGIRQQPEIYSVDPELGSTLSQGSFT